MSKLVFLLLLVLPSMTVAQVEEYFLPTTVDSRSAAMGRSSIMAASGSSAIFSNPATLATLDDMQVQGGGRSFVGIIVFDEEGANTTSRYNPNVKPNHLSFSMPYEFENVNAKFAFGLGYQNYFDFAFTYREEDGDDVFVDKVKGGLNTISPAVAVNFEDKYSVGVALNRSFASRIKEEVEFDGQEDETADVATSGTFINLGASAQITPELTLGIMYRSSFEWDWDVEDGSVRQFIPEVSGTEIEWHIPAIYGIGASFDVSPSLTVVGEFQSRPFSNYEVKEREVFNVDDGYSVRLGAEMQGDVPLRIGVFRDATLSRDAGNDNPNSLFGVTGGIGFDLGGIVLDTALEASRLASDLGDGDDVNTFIFRAYLSALYKFNQGE